MIEIQMIVRERVMDSTFRPAAMLSLKPVRSVMMVMNTRVMAAAWRALSKMAGSARDMKESRVFAPPYVETEC
jgi:hypothetical protein